MNLAVWVLLAANLLLKSPYLRSEKPSTVFSDSVTEGATDLIAEHESNGPEGARGIPMQRLSMKGGLIVFAVVLGSGALVTLAIRGKSSTGPSNG